MRAGTVVMDAEILESIRYLLPSSHYSNTSVAVGLLSALSDEALSFFGDTGRHNASSS